MATSYTSLLRLAQPAQGELSGTWGTVVNDNITAMIEEAISGSVTLDAWVADAHTLTTANGTTDESRPAILFLTDTTTDLTGAGNLICPTTTKSYIVKNDTGQIITVKTSAGTGIAIADGIITHVFCDGTNVERVVPAASATVAGIAELATIAETNTGTDATRIVTPDGLDGWTGSAQLTTVGIIASGTWNGTVIPAAYLPDASLTAEGIVELATQAEVDAGSDAVRAVTPATLSSYPGLGGLQATEDLAGVAELATTSEVTTGTDDLRIVTPLKLEGWNGSTSIGSVGTITAGTWQGTAINQTYLVDQSGTNTGDEVATTTGIAGVIELAIQAEVDAGSDTVRAVVPSTLNNWPGSTAITTLGTLTSLASGAATFSAEIVEAVFAIPSSTTPELDPADGTIQTWTLTGASTPTSVIADGEYITLHILDGSANTITWPTMEWVGGSAPTLDTTDENIIELWNVSGTLYGAFVGVAS